MASPRIAFVNHKQIKKTHSCKLASSQWIFPLLKSYLHLCHKIMVGKNLLAMQCFAWSSKEGRRKRKRQNRERCPAKRINSNVCLVWFWCPSRPVPPQALLSVSVSLGLMDYLHILLCYQRSLPSHVVRKYQYTGYRQRHFSDWLET